MDPLKPPQEQALPSSSGSAKKYQQFRPPTSSKNMPPHMQMPKEKNFFQLAGRALGKSASLGFVMFGGMIAFTYGMSQGLDNRRRNKHEAGIGGTLNLQDFFKNENTLMEAKNMEIEQMMKNRESIPGQHLYENVRAPRVGEPQGSKEEYMNYLEGLEKKVVVEPVK